jgi:hypothetical protein
MVDALNNMAAGELAMSEQFMEAILTELCMYASKSCLPASTTNITTSRTTSNDPVDTEGAVCGGVDEDVVQVFGEKEPHRCQNDQQ